MDKSTEDILRTIRSQKDYLRNILDDIPSIDSDEVLNDINTKLNLTSDAIAEYKNHLNEFKLSKELNEYLSNYGRSEVNPKYQPFQSLLNSIYKDVIISNLNKNAENYQMAYNYEEFIEKVNKTYEEIKDNYIDTIYNSSHLYYDNYTDNLDEKINNIKLRRLDNDNEEDAFERKVADISLDEIFYKLLGNSLQIKQFIQSWEKFNEFDTKISDSKNDLNSSYKRALKLIEDNNYEEEIRKNLENRLNDLKNHSYEYYDLINESFYNLKDYLNNTMTEIDDLLKDCANITFETFAKKYMEYLNKVEPIDNSTKDDDSLDYESDAFGQNNQLTVNMVSENMIKEAKFKYYYEYNMDKKTGIKIPKLKTDIDNLSQLKKVTIQIVKELTLCAKEITELEIVFNKANYSVSLEFSPNSTNILETISTLFDDYQYTIERYNTTDESEPVCIVNNQNKTICFHSKCTKVRDQTIEQKRNVIIDRIDRRNQRKEIPE